MKSTWRMLVLTIISIGPLAITASCSSDDGGSATIVAETTNTDLPTIATLSPSDIAQFDKTQQELGETQAVSACGVFL